MSEAGDRLRRLFGAPVQNMTHAFYDGYVEVNARFRQRAGMRAVIIRRELASCCEWCAALAGTYDIDDAPEDIYRRHDNCKCMVTARTERGTYQDVWSKKEYQTQREARIAREQELESEAEKKRTPYRAQGATLRQENLAARPPREYEHNFDDFRELELSEIESQSFMRLHEASQGYEYLCALVNGEVVAFRSDYDRDKVGIPRNITERSGTTLLHSHTGNTPPSPADLRLLTNENIDKIGVIANNGDVFIVAVGNGYHPGKDEFDEAEEELRRLADEYAIEQGLQNGWSPEEINYIAVREELYRLALRFEWTVQGGLL